MTDGTVAGQELPHFLSSEDVLVTCSLEARSRSRVACHLAHEERPDLVADAVLALFCGAHASKQSQTRVLEIKMAYSPRTIYIIRYY